MPTLAHPSTTRLAEEIGRLSHLIAQLTAAQRAALPTLFGMPELRAKWPGLSDDQIKALAAEHAGYQGGAGRRVTLHLDQVLLIDAILAGRVVAHGLRPAGSLPCSESNAPGAA